MNSTNDDATKPIPKQKGAEKANGSPEKSGHDATSGDSKLAALSGAVTARMAAVRDGKGDPEGKSSSRSASRTGGAGIGGAGASVPRGGKNAGKGVGAGTGTAARTGGAAGTADRSTKGGRRVRLTLARIDPWSVMKFSFLVALAIGLATVIAVALLWNIVDAIGLWDKLQDIGKDFNSGKPLSFMEYFEFSKMISYAIVVSFLNVIIMTALGTLGAFLYNIVAALLGGIKVTFTDS